ncbi:unnamed protein product [Didymodactylos carnosus]|uniref:Uncharacterized protein n=2 Tax=Didymodactylos carnosus TaxID=1234261 RepID=A0A8S2SA11_9BILA|nr:unnamed protein product [Didymodactylos carnosus]CAF4210965.1 unnamed protein product [Didymodactylos carnosus]
MILPKKFIYDILPKSPVAFIGTLVDIVDHNQTGSLHSYDLTFENIQLLRGNIVQEKAFLYRKQSHPITEQNDEQRKLELKREYLACLNNSTTIHSLFEIDFINDAAELVQIAGLPVGWSKQTDEYFSPWKNHHRKWWSSSSDTFKNVPKCNDCQRPALTTGDSITMSVKRVDNKSQFELTVTNTSDKPVQIPALVCDKQSKIILWHDSIFVMSNLNNDQHFFPKTNESDEVECVELGPYQSISIILDITMLNNLILEQDDTDISLIFCLGEKSAEINL